MKFLFSVGLSAMLLFASCNSQIKSNENNLGVQSVLAALHTQQECWNNGDIDCFMAGYWQNDSLMFVSGDNVAYGWQKVLDNYKRKYNTPELMGHLTFNVVKTDQLSSDAIMVVGSWKLNRDTVDIQGKFSLLWRNIDGEWKIVIDHTS